MALLLTHQEPLFGIWKIEESTEELLTMLENKSDYLKAIDKYRNDGRKKEWLACRILLKHLLGKENVIEYHPNGAPYLVDEQLSISFSHTKGYAAVLVQNNPNAGIDIEYHSSRIRKIRQRFLSEQEESFIEFQHEIEMLLICWCSKETLYKMVGKAETDLRDDFTIQPFSYKENGSIEICNNKKSTVYTLNYLVEKDFVVVHSYDNSLKLK